MPKPSDPGALRDKILGLGEHSLHKSHFAELRQRVRELEASEDRFSVAFKASPALLVLSLLKDARMLEVNPAFCEALGYAREELLGRSALELDVWDDPEERTRILAMLAAGRTVKDEEVHLQRKDGSSITTLASVERIRIQDADGLFFLALDVTERRRIEEALRVSEARLRAAFEHLPFDFWVCDMEGRYLLQNPASEAHWGDRVGRLVGELDLLPELRVVWEDRAARALAGETVRYEEAYPEGKELRHVLGLLAPILEGGRVRGILGVDVDVSEQKQAEAERQRLQAQLTQSQKMEAIGQLAGGVAHDFNNLLTVITLQGELLRERLEVGGAVPPALEEILLAARRAQDLTRQLLVFGRKQVLQPRLVSLNEELTEAEKMLRRLIGEHILLETRYAEGLPPVHADPGQLTQVVLNLAINARDAMPEGGRLFLETQTAELDAAHERVRSGELEPGSYVVLAVGDTGCGMDRATLARIFEPFFTTKEAGKGTGLGLATVYGIVKQSGGQIWVYSEPGLGTQFRIYLPRADAVLADAVLAEAAPQALRAGRGTVLVVEDEAGIRELVVQALDGWGYRVLAAGDPPEARRLAVTHDGGIDLLLTDMIMPNGRGDALAAELSASRPDLKVIIMSGYTDAAVQFHGADMEGLAFLQKPFTLRELNRRLGEMLGG
jgi:PAS domain S-box-containing protein